MIQFEAFIDAIQDAVVKANDALLDSNIGLMETFFNKTKDGDKEKLVPVTVTMDYPHVTSKGVEMVSIEVPLITMAPIQSSQIEELKFSTELEIMLVDDKLQVGFGKQDGKRKLFEGPNNKETSTAKIEMTLKPTDAPEGFKQLVEGYEKALRAQLPY